MSVRPSVSETSVLVFFATVDFAIADSISRQRHGALCDATLFGRFLGVFFLLLAQFLVFLCLFTSSIGVLLVSCDVLVCPSTVSVEQTGENL
jgi:hypothetical protein